MKEKVFRNADDVNNIVCKLWREVRLDKVKLVFQE
jgi:hypothetical protein